jgi:hypothetical protein
MERESEFPNVASMALNRPAPQGPADCGTNKSEILFGGNVTGLDRTRDVRKSQIEGNSTYPPLKGGIVQDDPSVDIGAE